MFLRERGSEGARVNNKIPMIDIDINEYDYDLPEERIAQFPLKERDRSKLLLFDGRDISTAVFSDIDRFLPSGSLLVFNNTRVIRARLLFAKTSVQYWVLPEPLSTAMKALLHQMKGWNEMHDQQSEKWKTGRIYLGLRSATKKHLCAEKICPEGDAWRIRFRRITRISVSVK
jgi:S-adenosylmethionine:tRNA ribosyltransferase-isomerase